MAIRTQGWLLLAVVGAAATACASGGAGATAQATGGTAARRALPRRHHRLLRIPSGAAGRAG